MTRTDIKQAAKILLGIPRSSLNGYDRALITADELIDKLEADRAKLREPLVYYAMLGSGRCNISKKHVEMAQQALKDTSDE